MARMSQKRQAELAFEGLIIDVRDRGITVAQAARTPQGEQAEVSWSGSISRKVRRRSEVTTIHQTASTLYGPPNRGIPRWGVIVGTVTLAPRQRTFSTRQILSILDDAGLHLGHERLKIWHRRGIAREFSASLHEIRRA
jgi:hypothetical protein